MPGNQNQKLKMLYLAKILTEKTDEEHPLNAAELCEMLEHYGVSCERKSIYTDIDILNEFGYDIEKTVSPKRGYYIGERDFQIAELRILIDAVAAAGSVSKKKTGEIIKKLRRNMSEYQQKVCCNTYIDKRKKAKNETIYYTIDAIERAIAENVKLKVKYIRIKLNNGLPVNSERTFIISPYALFWMDDKYYLVGNNQKYDNLMHIRIDRIKEIELTDEPCRHFSEVSHYRYTFDVADYTAAVYNGYGGEIKKITLRCKNEAAQRVMDEFGSGVQMFPCDDSSFKCTIKAVDSDGFIKTVLQMGTDIEVISPADVRERVVKELNTIRRMYNKK